MNESLVFRHFDPKKQNKRSTNSNNNRMTTNQDNTQWTLLTIEYKKWLKTADSLKQ